MCTAFVMTRYLKSIADHKDSRVDRKFRKKMKFPSVLLVKGVLPIDSAFLSVLEGLVNGDKKIIKMEVRGKNHL